MEADHLDHETVLSVAESYLGDMVGAYTGRGRLFPEDLDTTDPWQFRSFRAV